MKKRKRRFGCLTVIFVIVTFFMFRDSNSRVVTEYFDVSPRGLPASFEGYRIAVVSDLHAKEFSPGNTKLLEQVRVSRPDIIALTGDLIDAEGQLDMAMEFVAALSKIAPVYFVSGNHDWASGEADELFRRLPEAGAVLLDNTYVELERGGETVLLAGLADPNGPADAPSRGEVMAALPDSDCVVVLVHRNSYLEELSGYGADLILCGHAHGGVIRLPGTDGLIGHNGLFPKYTNGIYEYGGSLMLVSRGLGNVFGIPRLLNNPQIAVAVLHSYS